MLLYHQRLTSGNESLPLDSPKALSEIRSNGQPLEWRVFSWKYLNSEAFQNLFDLSAGQQRVTIFLLPKVFSSSSPHYASFT